MKDLIHIDVTSKTSVADQLYTQIVALVESGNLSPDKHILPENSIFARQLGISRRTTSVYQAFNRLVQNGYGYYKGDSFILNSKNRALFVLEDAITYAAKQGVTKDEIIALCDKYIKTDDSSDTSDAFQKHMEKLISEEKSKENLLFHSDGCMIGIYQLKYTSATSDILFVNTDFLAKKGLKPVRENYILVYTFPTSSVNLKDKLSLLEDIYYAFNTNHPDDYEGHSLSVSDVVVIKENNKLLAYYVDSFGFKPLKDFVTM